MINITKETINTQKNEIATFALQAFEATYISVLNGKNTYLQRKDFNFAHLRFTKILDVHTDGSATTLDKKEYKDTYVYVTTSTTTNKESHDFDSSDRCFRVRAELLRKPVRKCNYIFLVDYGRYWMYCTLDWALNPKNQVMFENYKGREVVTIRLPNRFYKKEKFFNCDPNFDATYLQNVTYTKYRTRKGFIKVEGYKKGQLQVVSYYTSTGALHDEFKLHGLELTNDYIRKVANKGGSIKKGDLEYKISRISEVEDHNYYSSLDSSSIGESGESGLPLQSYLYLNNNNNNNNIINKIVMVNQTKVWPIEEKSKVESIKSLDLLDHYRTSEVSIDIWNL